MGNSKKFRAKKKNVAVAPKYTGIQKNQPLIGKGKIILMLVFGTAFVAGIYITAIKLMFAPIMHIYWIITTFLLIAFFFVKSRNEYIYAQITSDGELSEEEKTAHLKRIKALKYLLIVLIPFLFTLIGDVVYLFILKDLDIIGAIKNLT